MPAMYIMTAPVPRPARVPTTSPQESRTGRSTHRAQSRQLRVHRTRLCTAPHDLIRATHTPPSIVAPASHSHSARCQPAPPNLRDALNHKRALTLGRACVCASSGTRQQPPTSSSTIPPIFST
eukprot:4522830-Pleurochrysis_carterae.AAC.2